MRSGAPATRMLAALLLAPLAGGCPAMRAGPEPGELELSIDIYRTALPEAEVLALLDLGPRFRGDDVGLKNALEAGTARLVASGRFDYAAADLVTYLGASGPQRFVSVDLVDRGGLERLHLLPAPQGETGDPGGLLGQGVDVAACRCGAIEGNLWTAGPWGH